METQPTLERALGTVLSEILDGSRPDSGLLLNRGDGGLLSSLDGLSAAEASALPPSGAASIAAHVDHLRYGLGLLNRWGHGEDPFEDADWTASWRRNTVSEPEWEQLRAQLRDEAKEFQSAVGRLLGGGETKVTGVIAEVAHLAYHLGAIRQIDRSVRGPDAESNRPAA
ncbi:MAG TPA: DinB family protein [Rubricoccaceae bacterium]